MSAQIWALLSQRHLAAVGQTKIMLYCITLMLRYDMMMKGCYSLECQHGVPKHCSLIFSQVAYAADLQD
jgi:hypothetical protein